MPRRGQPCGCGAPVGPRWQRYPPPLRPRVPVGMAPIRPCAVTRVAALCGWGCRMAANADARIHRLEVVIDELQAAVQGLSGQLAMVAAATSNSGGGGDTDEATTMRDTVWSCASCAARLGIYDEKSDELRVRYKDFICYVRPGAGGVVEVPCRRCGQRNRLEDARRP